MPGRSTDENRHSYSKAQPNGNFDPQANCYAHWNPDAKRDSYCHSNRGAQCLSAFEFSIRCWFPRPMAQPLPIFP